MGNQVLPKHIREKCRRMAKLCSEATSLRIEVEKWCEKNNIDTMSSQYYDSVRDEMGGCDIIIDANALEELLCKD